MNKCHIKLVIQAIDIFEESNCYLLDGDEIITREIIPEIQPWQQVGDIIQEYTGIDEQNNLRVNLVGCYNQSDTFLLYSVIVPKKPNIEKGKWYSLNEVLGIGNPLIQTLIQETSTYH